MYNHEEKARSLHRQGNNCSTSLHKAFEEDMTLSGDYPMPRSIDGKCGALLAAIKILKDTGHEDKVEEFEKQFKNKFEYVTCMELMTHGRKCNDYVGESAKMIDQILNS